jgi:DNA protecting protein DprA
VASELAADLAAEGVVVVSGLAEGIDGAAHAGAVRTGLEATGPPAAVVGTGLDVIYPPTNASLWEQVAREGVVLSEAPLGTRPFPGVFPARNRIIAALSDVVVVVECHRRGGSIYTVEAAARRSIPVCAVPGSVMSPASDGTNALLVDGCAPVRDAADVLVAVSLARAGRGESQAQAGADQGGPAPRAASTPVLRRRGARTSPDNRSRAPDPGPPMTADQRAVWKAVDDTPTSFETVLLRTGLSIVAAAEACEHLAEVGALREGAGWWSKEPSSARAG